IRLAWGIVDFTSTAIRVRHPMVSRECRPRTFAAGRCVGGLFLSLFMLLLGSPALADTVPPPASPPPGAQSTPSSLLSWTEARGANEVAGNPGAVNTKPGIGVLGRTLGLEERGIFLGGVWVGNTSYLFGGGTDPKSWNSNSLEIIGTDIDLEKLIGLPGSEIGAQFLQFDGQPTNQAAGVVTGYDGLPGSRPLDRSELYQLWWRQRLFGDKLIIRVGKVAPTTDFNNVIRPIPVRDESYSIPA